MTNRKILTVAVWTLNALLWPVAGKMTVDFWRDWLSTPNIKPSEYVNATLYSSGPATISYMTLGGSKGTCTDMGNGCMTITNNVFLRPQATGVQIYSTESVYKEAQE